MRALIAALMLAIAPPAAAQEAAPIVGPAVVYDGDTFTVAGVEIRLWGVDSPECGRRCAGGVNPYLSATEALRGIIADRPLRCVAMGLDPHRRTVARCTVAGRDLAAEMVRGGWARDWCQYSHAAYAPIEAGARAARRGLWALDCPELWGRRRYSCRGAS